MAASEWNSENGRAAGQNDGLDGMGLNMDTTAIVGPGYLEMLDTIPEDVSVAAAALHHATPQSMANLSTASAIASSDSSEENPVVIPVEEADKKKQRRGKRRQGGGAPPTTPSGGVDNVSDTHASLGGATESLERQFAPSQDGALPHVKPTTAVCTRRTVIFFAIVSTLLVVIGVGIYFIVENISNNNDNSEGTLEPTPDPMFPPYNVDGESSFPSSSSSFTEKDIMDIDAALLKISGSNDDNIYDMSTPEGKCRYWLTHEDQQELRVEQVGEHRIQQRYILCTLYYSTNGDFWTVDSWLNGQLHECDWYGIACDVDDVAGITLENKNLTGPLPKELESLDNLQLLILSSNSISSSIPDNLFDIDDLIWVELSVNQMIGTIPQKKSGISALEVLHLKYNQLEGNLPFFPNLERVYVQRNLLTSIDARYMSSVESLVELKAYDNLLSGPLPSKWNTSKLEYLDLGLNNFTGTISQELWNLPRLKYLVVDDNQITGGLPAASGSPSLQRVWLYSNQLSGSIPENFGSNWQQLTSLKIQDNALTGDITLEQCNRWPASSQVLSGNASSATDGWRLEADCNLATMDCACCTQCFPLANTGNRKQ